MSELKTSIASQVGFLQGEITDALLPGTPAEDLHLAPAVAITNGRICRWLSRIFTCAATCRPITRDPTECPKSPPE